MGLIRLFLYDRPMSMGRFLAELSVALILVALATAYLAASTLARLQ